MAEEFNTEGMLDVYLFENGQLLEQLQEIVLDQKDAECFDEDSINEIFRTMHTIKGSSGIMMFEDITAVAHKLEDIFFYLRESPRNLSTSAPGLPQRLLSAACTPSGPPPLSAV